ncbi:MAG: hypothetical protein FD168_582 [Desulfobulbaceae bacterium]|nr:MAG: hypothetical protein FD168_582 [Desulfobulbaceae bacterium]
MVLVFPYRSALKIPIMLSRLFLFALLFIAPTSSLDVRDAESAMNTYLTPAPGTFVRKAILDCVREELKRLHGLEVVFVVQHLKVKDSWAWIHVRPQSADGREHYEDVAALLTMKDGEWTVAEIPCMEVDNLGCPDSPEFFAGLSKRFPKMPAEILPAAEGKTLGDKPED